MHGEFELAGLRRSLELHLHGDNFESRSTIRVERRLVESGETERWYSNLALPRVGKEDVPLGLSVAGKIGCVGERDVVLLDFLVLGLEVALGGIGVFKISFGDRWDFGGARRDEAGLDGQLNKR